MGEVCPLNLTVKTPFLGVVVGRKPGKQNIPKDAAQKQVLELLSQGTTITDAMAAVGRNDVTFRQWSLTDPDFKAEADKARLAGKGVKADMANLKDISFEDFSEQFLDTKLFDHHKDWVDLIEGREPRWLHPAMTYEPAASNRVLINVPPEHAKSTVITINYVTYRIATDPNVRIIVVSKTQGMARKFLSAIKTRMSHPNWTKLQMAFGPNGGYKADSQTWSADMIYLGSGRDSGEKDPTVQALGFGSQIYGARADLIILDDVVMNSNSHEWEKQIEWLQKEVITRLGRWTDRAEGEKDQPNEQGFYPKWDGPSLFTRRSEVAPSIWAMVYQQEDVVEDSIFPPACVAGSSNGMRKRGPLKSGTPGHPKHVEGTYTVIGFDPAVSGRSAFVAVTYNKGDGKVYVLDCVNMVDPSPQKERALIEEWVERYKPQEFRVEINAHQKAYQMDTDLVQYLAQYGCKLNPHYTGKNKWDTSFGVASMSALFGSLRDGRFQDNNLIELPSNEGSEGLKSLTQQLITWKPDTKNPTDCVMALWFAIIRVRELMQQSSFATKYSTNRWATRRQKDMRYSVNLDEAFAEQWSETYG